MQPTNLLTPKQAAKYLNVTTRTLHRWDKAGKIKSVRTPSGARRFPLDEIEKIIGKVFNNRCCIYIRLKSKNLIGNGYLEIKKNSLIKIAQQEGYEIVHTIVEVGSNLKENRPSMINLLRLANEKAFDILLIDNPSILIPFGFSYLKEQLSLLNIKLHIVENAVTSKSAKENIRSLLTLLIKEINSSFIFTNLEKKRVEHFKRKIYLFMKTLKP